MSKKTSSTTSNVDTFAKSVDLIALSQDEGDSKALQAFFETIKKDAEDVKADKLKADWPWGIRHAINAYKAIAAGVRKFNTSEATKKLLEAQANSILRQDDAKIAETVSKGNLNDAKADLLRSQARAIDEQTEERRLANDVRRYAFEEMKRRGIEFTAEMQNGIPNITFQKLLAPPAVEETDDEEA